MKTRTTSSKLILLLLIGLALSATTAQAIVIEGSRPVGITFGQTARVTAANTGTTAIVISGGKFLDSDGNILAEFASQVIDPGKMMSLTSMRMTLFGKAIGSRSGASLPLTL